MSSSLNWRNELSRLAPPVNGAPPRLAIVGVGQMLRGDDAAGPAVIHHLIANLEPADNLLLLDAAHAPENILGPITRFHPTILLFVDALRAGQPPGTILWLPAAAADATGGSTHTLPLSVLAEFITAETGATVYVLGIQPATTDFGLALSPAVTRAVAQVAAELTAYWRRLNAACSAMSTGDVSVVNT
ncbi:putative Hydrogenase maturation protease [Candidatus Promineifilum breve]|uniref:Hydrogenase maturation protease n=1 Tax=Candidatus Promineifilum breve TaxID=1806508 RepID=A0A170PDP5_9CHLR|nr:hydrogenase 3 maturation endopeptidase HyCI [Candidatus Promineifilum breve]CUS02137.2 putative Hydrogenase maturation protease [Candidatus Promineifilum breve]